MKYTCRLHMLIFVLLAHVALGQQQLQIKSLSIENGLSNNSVRCIFQDKKGFLWFGTYDGLNRYDGYEFKVFRNKFNDTTSLQHNYIYAISEDSKQNIWVGTGQGLTILDPVTDTFHSAYFRPSWSHKLQKFNYSITFIKADSKGNLFIGTNNAGLFLKKANDDVCVQLPYKAGNDGYTGVTCQGISITRNETWIFVANYGLCRFNYKSEKLELVDHAISFVNCICGNDDGNVFLGSTEGLYEYVTQTQSVRKIFPVTTVKGTESNVIGLLMTDRHGLYISVERDGLYVLNVISGKLTAIPQGETPGSLESKIIMDLYQDHESRIWLATLRTGINVIDYQKDNFRTISNNKGDPNSLVSNLVTSFCESDADHIWIGTEDRGLSIWSNSKNRAVNFSHIKDDPSTLSSGEVTSIKRDFTNRIWVATFGGGVNRFNPLNNSFEHFVCKNKMTGEIHNEVWLLFEDSRKTLWAGTFTNGRLFTFDRKKKEFLVFDQQISDPYALYEDREGQLWCGTAYNLVKLDTVTKHHQYYGVDKPVRSIYEDHAGRFWLGTEGGGICLFDRKTGKITERYTDAAGLSNNAVLNILEDEAGKLWLSTFQGITNFDPNKRKLTGYYASDGLQSNQFSLNAALKLKSGKLLFGGIKGFNIFDPAAIVARDNMPKVVFTNININNKGITDFNKILSNNTAAQLQGVRVPYNDAVLAFSFAGLEFSSPDHILYAYYLEGWDKKWIQSGKQRTINYNNLPEGNYTLHVRSTNALGKWNNKQTSLKIIVLPPWFRSWWAYLGYLLSLSGLIYIFIRYKSNQAKLKYQVQLERMNSEKEHEINLRKTSFFTHVSHEFRTPLMLIINPLQEMVSNLDGQKNENLNIVYRNARRLLSLIDQLLLFNKTENGNDDLEVSLINFSVLCRLIFESFLYQARNKNIDYKFLTSGDEIFLYGDKAKLEVILYNLLSNAFKFTKAGGSIIMNVDDSANKIDVSVSDNGHGISADVGDHLFEKFYRSRNKEARQKAGFGIGLYLVQQFVLLHKGEVTYKSRIGEGTTFFLSFNKGKEHFEGLEVTETSDQEAIFLEELSGEQVFTSETFAGVNVKELVNNTAFTSETPRQVEQTLSSKKTMLIIDDHADMRTYLKQIFFGDFTIIEANNGDVGIQLAKEFIPDIILSDIMMDDKDGLEFCREVRENPSLTHIPVILITASLSPEIKLSGVKGGADDYFTKPINKELLVARINTLLNNRNNLQNYFFRKVTLQEYNVKISEDEKGFVDQCISVIEDKLEDDDFTIDELAREINMSRSNLYKKIRAVSNQTPNNFVKYIRLRRAAEYFISSGHNVNEVALLVGFKDVKYFREHFFQLFGLKPSEYIKKYRQSFSKKISLNVRLKKHPHQGN